MRLLRNQIDLPAAVRRRVRARTPMFVRERLYDWNPGRKRKWREASGTERLFRATGVALTFDDGPDPVWTPAVLAALREANATATFFVVGSEVEKYPEVVRQIVADGHEVALHGMQHCAHDLLSRAEIRAEMIECSAAIERACGVVAGRYRPPFGRSSDAMVATCRELDLELTYWSSWGQDWDPIGAARIARLVGRHLEPGAIILLHDSAFFAPREDPGATLDSIPLIAADAAAKNLALTSVARATRSGSPGVVGPAPRAVAVSQRAHA